MVRFPLTILILGCLSTLVASDATDVLNQVAEASTNVMNQVAEVLGVGEPESKPPLNITGPPLNVYQDPLASCSLPGMARTGYTCTSQCEEPSPNGSHNVCLDISSTEANFCNVTGQDNWCEEKKVCDEDDDQECDVVNFCVCEWAFATYLNKAGGCKMIDTIICEATNLKVVRHYQEQIEEHGDVESEVALECLKAKCGNEIVLEESE